MPIFSKSFKKSEELKFTELFRKESQKGNPLRFFSYLAKAYLKGASANAAKM